MEPTAEAAARRAAFARNRSLTMTRTKRRWWRSDARALKEILSNWANVLLVTVPLGLIAGALNWTAEYVFVLNFLALIPLALILGDVTEDLALRYGSVIGGLINATFGNIVEVILSIAALLNGLYGVVAASLLGSILSNLLLVTGCSFFFGGLFNKTQKFNATGSQASGSLLFLAALGFLIPTGAALLFGSGDVDSNSDLVLGISRGTAVVLLLCYGCYLGFQLYTHTDLFEDTPEESSASLWGWRSARPFRYLTSSLTEFSKSSGLSEAFLGTIVLPIAGNACEHMTAVIVATKNKMDLSMGVAVGSSIQVALFAVPFAVVVGWITGHPFTLDFDPFSAMALMLSVAQSNFVTAGATSHWLLGVQLIALYVLLSLAYYFK
ncbi:Ca2+/H+ antiporter, cation antiporter, membrane protein [Volvox carteri f. nagariensis]|uniref:Ca2+/H+ antiporter, cation antiporter, membrane protein n=1 Tax=Volvox carteri f. nagariensis TaxID=3068 RepID=D8U439_VOLCA|nr:Ca2+/H+ antiporter, cation antiporter, membrane protein [Volvox carteri f. nagariensis]EFJ45431.1 Ca2+/H+ antiporter, cation antiporter, membrane protein [Volvox carteri f. nagariensis]|eukprot:XP_002953458.1 Ca2+/H+ antiporter, cation antiporter, membrane protein [Volvox carteri f. nagariensis]